MNTYEGPADSYGVREVKFKKDRESKFLTYIEDELKTAEGQHSRLRPKWELLVAQAKSRRKRRNAKTKDSQIDMPFTAKRIQGTGARIKNAIFQHDRQFTCKARTATADSGDVARNYEDVLDYGFDRFNSRALVEDFFEQAAILPVSIVKTPFVHEVKRIKRWENISLTEFEEMLPIPDDITVSRVGDAVYMEKDAEIIERSGVFPEVIPIEDFWFPLSAADVRTSPWVAHRVWLTKDDIACKIRHGVYKKKIGDQDVLDKLGQPQDRRDPLFEFEEKKDRVPAERQKQYEVFEIYTAFDVDGTGKPVEIIATYEKSTKSFLRVVYNFYHNFNRPFITWSYKPVMRSIYGLSLAYQLEPLHVGYSASVNQRLDAASKANGVMLLTPPMSGLKEQFDQEGLHDGVYETTDPEAIKHFVLSQPFSQLPELEQRFDSLGDHIAGLSPYSYGYEQSDRPTATGQVQVIEEGKQPTYSLLESFRVAYAEIAKHMLARYRQFYPVGLEIYTRSDPEAEEFMQKFVEWPDEAFEEDIIVETKASSATMSKQLRKQEAVAMLDKYPQIIQVQMQLAQTAADINNPAAPVAGRLLMGFQGVVAEFLTEFDVGKKDLLNPPNLTEMLQYGQRVTQQINQMGQQLQKLGTENQQLKMQMQGIPPGVPGAPGQAGPPGPPQGVPGPPQMGGGPPGPMPPQANGGM